MLGLENLFSWIPLLVTWCVSWLPTRERMPAHGRGVLISGPKVTAIEPGTYWYWPRWAEALTDNVKRKVQDLPKQTLTTNDGKRVRLGGVLVYHITNIETWLVENENAEHGVQVDAKRVLRDFVRTHSFEEIQDYKPTTRGADDLTRDAQAELGSDFGIRIRSLGLAEFCETDATDLYHSGALNGLSELEEE